MCDERQRLCLALALWNGADPILKERMFGLTDGEGNHGEDVKEYWFYLDSTPTHSYLKCQYKYPQRAFPYMDLVATNARRTKQDMEYELLDTGVFDDDRYFDVVVEYAKAAPDDILMLVTAYNRGPDPATLHLLPTLWFRNTWSWGDAVPKPAIAALDGTAARASHPELGEWVFRAEASADALVLRERDEQPAPVRDAERLAVRQGRDQRLRRRRRRRRRQSGADRHEAGGPPRARDRAGRERPDARPADRADAPTAADTGTTGDPLGDRHVRPRPERPARPRPTVLRDGHPRRRSTRTGRWSCARRSPGCCGASSTTSTTSTAGCAEHGVDPWLPNAPASPVRNVQWFHMIAGDIISMPDKWEYPWFAAWDLAFHCAPLSLVDVDFAKEQIELLLKTRYQHPNGQIPAYEWNFSDVNPPVTPWAALYVYEREAEIRGEGDHEFLARVFDRLIDELHLVGQPQGSGRPQPVPGRVPRPGQHRHVRSLGATPGGGRSSRPTGPRGWPSTASGCSQIAIELAKFSPPTSDMALKFIAHFMFIAVAMNPPARRRRAVGRRGRLLLRRDADAGRHPRSR